MKKQVISACIAGIVLIAGYGINVQASNGAYAGVTASLSQYISKEQALAMTTMNVTPEEATNLIEGYTNLGVANVENHLNIRETASEDSDIVGKLPKDAGCEILGAEGEWSKIESGKVTGYVKTEYLFTGEAATTKALEVMTKVATVTTETLFVRAEANTECNIIALVANGEDVEVIEELGDWIRVAIDGSEGYISAEYATVSTQLAKAMTITEIKYGEGVSNVKVDLVQYASQFVGNPYVWGGTSLTKGADCSGFTLSVYAKYGVSLPHSSGAQSGYGRRVNASEAQPGDLFFYGSGSGINHVAIYIGNGQIVHASSKKTGIKISNAFYRSPVCVTRLLD